MIDHERFAAVDVRAGTIREAAALAGARRPAYRLRIDFGPELGEKRSSAQITALYRPEELVGTQVLAVVNLPVKRIAGFVSEVLTLGFPDANGDVVLARPDRRVPDGARMY